MINKLDYIVHYYGINHQQRKLAEEVFELQEKITQFQCVYSSGSDKYFKECITEEIADVMVLLKQIQLYYKLDTKEIKNNMKYKINRQIERIKNGSSND